MMKRQWVSIVALVIAMAVPGVAMAQGTAPPPQSSDDPDRDLRLVVGEPDFTLGVLPTTLRLPKGESAFRITHRFTYQINDGSFGEFVENGFGFDSSATSGFEVRFGVAAGTQLVLHRTGSRNIQFLAQRQLVAQGDGRGLSFDLLAGIEGQNNFREEFSYVAGGVLSHRLGDAGALYLEPIYVVNAKPELPASDLNTLVIGMGARIRLGGSRTYLVAEVAPRVGDEVGGSSVMTFGIEKRAGGHMFQINVSNAFGTTLTQVGHGGPSPKHWHLGFNLTRKFY